MPNYSAKTRKLLLTMLNTFRCDACDCQLQRGAYVNNTCFHQLCHDCVHNIRAEQHTKLIKTPRIKIGRRHLKCPKCQMEYKRDSISENTPLNNHMHTAILLYRKIVQSNSNSTQNSTRNTNLRRSNHITKPTIFRRKSTLSSKHSLSRNSSVLSHYTRLLVINESQKPTEASHTTANEAPLSQTSGITGQLSATIEHSTRHIHKATCEGNLDLVKQLLREQPQSLHAYDEAGWQPLHIAAAKNGVAIGRVLLEAGARPDDEALPTDSNKKDGMTVLSAACCNSHAEFLRLLFDWYAKHAALSEHDAALNTCSSRNRSLEKLWQELRRDLQTRQAMPNPACFIISMSVLVDHAICPIVNGRILQRGELVCDATHLLVGANFLPPKSSDNNKSNFAAAEPENRFQHVPLKYLAALLKGIWIINFEWASRCIASNTHLPEQSFEVDMLDLARRPGTASNLRMMGAPRRARTAREAGLPGLFSGCHFCFFCNSGYPFLGREELCALVEFGGATALREQPTGVGQLDSVPISKPDHIDTNQPEFAKWTGKFIFVVYHEKKHLKSLELRLMLQSQYACLVSYDWLLDSILQYRILPPNYADL